MPAEDTDGEFLEDADARRPIPPARIAVAAVLTVGLLLLSILYHDGVIATDDPGDVSVDHGVYRLRGTAADVTEEGFVLRSGDAAVHVRWNLTTPPVAGGVYVVSGVWNATAESLDGEAVVRALLF